MNGPVMDTVREVDQTFLFVFIVAAALFLLIALSMIVILVRYHYSRHPEAARFKGNALAELIWVAVPALIVLAMFASGWKSYLALQTPPEGAMRVDVVARKWSWAFTYENGRVTSILYVPVNRAVFLRMTSADVLHSFFAPAFRIKRDTVPGMTTSLWFRASNVGTFDVMCAEYCGTGHSAMHTTIAALTQEAFDRWYEGGEAPEGRDMGMALYMKYGCTGCHPLGNVKGIGPSLEDAFGKNRLVVTARGETTMVEDEAYLRRAILRPNEEVVKGYPPIMPSFEGRIPEEELEKLLTFLSTLTAQEIDGPGQVAPGVR